MQQTPAPLTGRSGVPAVGAHPVAPAEVVSRAELDGQAVELLPRRDTLCYIGCVDVQTVVGVNLAFAVNAASVNTTANALAAQYLVALR